MDTLLGILLFVAMFVLQVQMAPMLFRDCGNGEIESITIEPCAAQPCHFDQGDRANLSITFVPKTHNATGIVIKNTLRSYTGYIKVEVAEEDPTVCRANASDWGKLECPLEKDKRYTFVINRAFPASTSYNIFRYSKLRFLTDDGRLIACADMRLQFQWASAWKSAQFDLRHPKHDNMA